MKSAIRMMLFTTLALLGTASAARAQIVQPERFTVPFTFEVNHHLMPAGTYRLTPLSTGSNVFTLSEVDSTNTVLVSADGYDSTVPRRLDSDKVVFERSGDQYVMTQVWDAADGSAIQMTGTYPLTKAAQELERNNPDVKVIVDMKK